MPDAHAHKRTYACMYICTYTRTHTDTHEPQDTRACRAPTIATHHTCALCSAWSYEREVCVSLCDLLVRVCGRERVCVRGACTWRSNAVPVRIKWGATSACTCTCARCVQGLPRSTGPTGPGQVHTHAFFAMALQHRPSFHTTTRCQSRRLPPLRPVCVCVCCLCCLCCVCVCVRARVSLCVC